MGDSREFGRLPQFQREIPQVGRGKKDRRRIERVGRTLMFTVNFSWTSESAVYRSAGVKAAWTERARHACAHVAVPRRRESGPEGSS